MKSFLRFSLLLLAAGCVGLRPLYAQSAGAVCPPSVVAPSASPAVVPIDVANNHVYVKVCVAGRPLDFILDTGAGQTFIDLNTARQLQVALGSSFTARGAGAGTIAGAQVRDLSAAIAGSSIAQPIGAALDLAGLPAREGHAIDGILGYDFISSRVVAIDYSKAQLRLYDRATFAYTGSGSTLPLTFFNNHPHVDADIRLADGELVHGRFIIDVGSALGLSLTKPFVDDHRLRDRVGPTLRRPSGGGVGGPATADIGRVAGLRLGGIELVNPIASLFGDSAGVFSDRGTWVGNIGGEVLRRFTVYLDYRAKRMILEPNATLADAFETDMSGVAFVVNRTGEWRVDSVVPGSPASEAGLEAGDIIVAVDDKPATGAALGLLRQRFRRAGESVLLFVRREGKITVVSLVTRRLV